MCHHIWWVTYEQSYMMNVVSKVVNTICQYLIWHTVKQETFTSNLLSLFSRVGHSRESFLLEKCIFHIKIHVGYRKTWITIALYMYDMLNTRTLMPVNISCFTVLKYIHIQLAFNPQCNLQFYRFVLSGCAWKQTIKLCTP